MNDAAALQEWTEALAKLRSERTAEISRAQHSKSSFSPADFFLIASASLDKILSRWQALQPQTTVGGDPRSELEALFDFEMQAIERDLTDTRETVTWDPAEVQKAQKQFESTADEIKAKYSLKLSAAAKAAAEETLVMEPGRPFAPRPAAMPGIPKDVAPPAAPPSAVEAEATLVMEPAAAHAKAAGAARGAEKAGAAKDAAATPVKLGGGSGGGGGGGSVIGMFLLGILLGAAPSAYFWNLSRLQAVSAQQDAEKAQRDRRRLEDNIALLHQRFDELATGKLKSIPEIDRDVEKIQREIGLKKQAVEDNYTKSRQWTLKHTPRGGRLDKALAALDEDRNSKLAELETEEAQAVEPLQKEKNTLQELRAH